MLSHRRRLIVSALAFGVVISLGATTLAAGLEFKMDDGEAFAIERRPVIVGTTKRPVVVLLHGVDGLSEYSRPQIIGFADELASAGYVVFVPTYFGSGDGPLSGIPDSDMLTTRTDRLKEYGPRVARATEVALAQSDADSTRLAMVGFSLGGGLALEQAEASAGKVKAVVDFFGYIGSDTILKEVAKLPPTLVFHNPKDEIVNPNYSRDLLKALDNLTVTKVIHQGYFLDDENPFIRYHPFRRGENADIKSRDLTLKWLNQYL